MLYRNVDFVISINVHEKVDFLLKQLINIRNYIVGSYVVILNTNDYMYNELKKIQLDGNVFINSEYFNKSRHHGSLCKGIYKNMTYALQNFIFSYFIVLSSRNLFYRTLSKDIFNSRQKIKSKVQDYKSWHWPSFINTKLAKYYLNLHKDFNNLRLSNSAHEGVVFSWNSCIAIVNFLEKHNEIKEDLFNFPGCVEEFGLQTICTNETNNGYYDIGKGIDTFETRPYDFDDFVYKTNRI